MRWWVVQVEQLGELRVLWITRSYSTWLTVTEDARDPARLVAIFDLLKSVSERACMHACVCAWVRVAMAGICVCMCTDARDTPHALMRGISADAELPAVLHRLGLLAGMGVMHVPMPARVCVCAGRAGALQRPLGPVSHGGPRHRRRDGHTRRAGAGRAAQRWATERRRPYDVVWVFLVHEVPSVGVCMHACVVLQACRPSWPACRSWAACCAAWCAAPLSASCRTSTQRRPRCAMRMAAAMPCPSRLRHAALPNRVQLPVRTVICQAGPCPGPGSTAKQLQHNTTVTEAHMQQTCVGVTLSASCQGECPLVTWPCHRACGDASAFRCL